MQKAVGSDPSLWVTLNSGRVVPGYGHGVLRSPVTVMVLIDLGRKLNNALSALNKAPVVDEKVFSEHVHLPYSNSPKY